MNPNEETLKKFYAAFAALDAVAMRPALSLLLLHGFAQSHVMWNRVAQQLQHDFFQVMPDLRGYGDSSKAPGLPDQRNYSKRVMAQDMAEIADALGIASFFLCGRDRGSRVAQPTASGKIACNLLVLSGERGVVNRLFKPLALWQAQCAGQVTGQAMPAGHFIPEELPRDCDEKGDLFQAFRPNIRFTGRLNEERVPIALLSDCLGETTEDTTLVYPFPHAGCKDQHHAKTPEICADHGRLGDHLAGGGHRDHRGDL